MTGMLAEHPRPFQALPGVSFRLQDKPTRQGGASVSSSHGTQGGFVTDTAIHTPVHMHVCTNTFLIHIHAFTHLHTLA